MYVGGYGVNVNRDKLETVAHTWEVKMHGKDMVAKYRDILRRSLI